MPLTRKRFLDLAGRGALGAAAYSTLGFLGRAEAGGALNESCPPGTRPSDKRFIYRGSAVCVGGRITDPPHGEIPAQAATTLPPDGGYAEGLARDFNFHGIVAFTSARGLVRGNPDLKMCRPVFRTVATATVYGLDVDGVVTADTVVASLESEQPEDGVKLDMRPVSSFANLRLRGHQIALEPDPDLIALGTYPEICEYLRRPRRPHAPMPGHSESRYSYSIFDDDSIAAAVNAIEVGKGTNRRVTTRSADHTLGGHIHVDDFGDIYLGELFVDPEFRRLTTLRIVLGSPPSGVVDLASVEGDGRPS
jgi:hypothetical protein